MKILTSNRRQWVSCVYNCECLQNKNVLLHKYSALLGTNENGG